MAGIPDAVFVAHAAHASRTKAFCRRVALLRKPLFTLPGPENSALLAVGAAAIDPVLPAGALVQSQRKRGLTSAMVAARATVLQTGIGGRRIEP